MTKLTTVKLYPWLHDGKDVVQIHYQRNEELTQLLRASTHMRWSKTMNCWYLVFYKNIIQDLYVLSKNHFYLDYSELKIKELEAPKAIKELIPLVVKSVIALPELSQESIGKLEEFRLWLNSKRYSQSTIDTYTETLKLFLRFFAHKALNEITNNDLILFNNEYILDNHLSASFQNQIVNSVKLFFLKVEDKKLDPALIHRPKRPKLLPNVLSKEEVKLILNAHGNIKHKAMLSLIYSCGLRRGELLNLKLTDIDSQRGLVIIRQAKGRKDRVAPLSEKILQLLRDYYSSYKPKYWLFEGQDKTSQYDEKSLSSVLKQALEKSGIQKQVSLHWLRHSYATHLLENGTDLRYIQEILGHSSSRTTEIYTHVSNKNIQRITSPFDNL